MAVAAPQPPDRPGRIPICTALWPTCYISAKGMKRSGGRRRAPQEADRRFDLNSPDLFKVGRVLQKGFGRMRPVASLALILLLAGCAQSYQPVVDTKGVDTAKYQQDLFEC